MSEVKKIFNWVNGESVLQNSHEIEWLEKYDPHSGNLQSLFVDTSKQNLEFAIDKAESAFSSWSSLT